MLKYIRLSNDLLWLCISDFNKVLHRSEHEGITQWSYNHLASFREIVDVYGLCDLGYKTVKCGLLKRKSQEILSVASGHLKRESQDYSHTFPHKHELFSSPKDISLAGCTADQTALVL